MRGRKIILVTTPRANEAARSSVAIDTWGGRLLVMSGLLMSETGADGGEYALRSIVRLNHQTLRLSDADLRPRKPKLIHPDHRLPPVLPKLRPAIAQTGS